MWLPAAIAAGSQYRPPSRKLGKVGNPQGAGKVPTSSFWMPKCKEWGKFIFPEFIKKINSNRDLCFLAKRQEGLPRKTIFACKFECGGMSFTVIGKGKNINPHGHTSQRASINLLYFMTTDSKIWNWDLQSKPHVTNHQILTMDQISIVTNKTHSCLTSNIYDASMHKSHVPSICTI